MIFNKLEEKRKMEKEKEKVIKFSRLDYYKLRKIDVEKPITLMEVFATMSRSTLSKFFRDYDTIYSNEKSSNLFGEEYYELPKGELLVLLFIDSEKHVFTTIRSRYGKLGDKMPYYIKARGKNFRIKLEVTE